MQQRTPFRNRQIENFLDAQMPPQYMEGTPTLHTPFLNDSIRRVPVDLFFHSKRFLRVIRTRYEYSFATVW